MVVRVGPVTPPRHCLELLLEQDEAVPLRVNLRIPRAREGIHSIWCRTYEGVHGKQRATPTRAATEVLHDIGIKCLSGGQTGEAIVPDETSQEARHVGKQVVEEWKRLDGSDTGCAQVRGIVSGTATLGREVSNLDDLP